MKSIFITLACFIVTINLHAASSHDGSEKSLTKSQRTNIERNLLSGITNTSVEICAGHIQTLIDLEKAFPEESFDYATIPLMAKLKSECRDELRILAALALYHGKSEIGKYAIERRALYENNERVAKHCHSLIQNWDRPERERLTASL